MAKLLLLEIGCEELPSPAIERTKKEAPQKLKNMLEEAGLASSSVELVTTPRRLAFLAYDVPTHTQAKEEIFTGPAKEIAFAEDGTLSKAGAGFLRSKGASEKDVYLTNDGHIEIKRVSEAVQAETLFGELLEDFIASLSFARVQRWGSESVSFVRPVRSLVALFGDTALTVRFGDVTSDNKVYGHRVLSPEAKAIKHADEYKEVLSQLHVLDAPQRAEKIESDITCIEQERGAVVSRPRASFQEVVNLCEWPSVVVAQFEEEYLQVPKEIISDSLLGHQRYFPIFTKDGELTNDFVVVSNADPEYNKNVIEGNERVVRARLDDARFFYETDVKEGLDALLPKLKDVQFHKALGSVYQKAKRLEQLAPQVAKALGATPEEAKLAKRAGLLAKADLVSNTVIEFTQQQGVMGGYFARAQGEDERVTNAIAHQYYPRFSDDELPQGTVALAVSIADKIDTLAGLFAVSEIPTGSRDPFALRRQSIGILRMIEKSPSVDVSQLLAAALDLFEADGVRFDKESTLEELKRYLETRLSQLAKERGAQPDAIQAIAGQTLNTHDYFARLTALTEAREENPELFEHVVNSFARASHLVKEGAGAPLIDEALTAEQSALLKAITGARDQIASLQEKHQYKEALACLEAFGDALDGFFDSVMVMDEDLEVREANLALLAEASKLYSSIANFDALQVRKS